VTGETALGDSYFLSYSRADEHIALKFAKDLRELGIAMWVDQFDIRPSEHWDRAIEQAVRDCRGLVVVLSPRSTASDNVADEISYAIDHGKSVLPVMIERCRLPLRITRMQVVDATGDYDRALSKCRDALSGNPPVPLPPPAEDVRPSGVTDPGVIAAAKAHLTQILGPIAGLLVDKDAKRSSSTSELYALLAQHIEDEKVREQFLKRGGPAASTLAVAALPDEKKEPRPSVPAADVERLTAILTHYLGPMATLVVRKESGSATSTAELRQRLALRIAHEQDRADFLRRAESC
jgi:hypothetical protein